MLCITVAFFANPWWASKTRPTLHIGCWAMTDTGDSQSPQTLLEKLAQDRKKTAYGLFAAAALLAVIPLTLILKYKSDYAWVSAATIVLALIPLAAGLW